MTGWEDCAGVDSLLHRRVPFCLNEIALGETGLGALAMEALSFMSWSLVTHRAKEAEVVRKTCMSRAPKPVSPNTT